MKNIFKSILRVSIVVLITIIIIFVLFFRKEIFSDKDPFWVAIWTLKLEMLNKDYISIWEHKYITKYNFDLKEILEEKWYLYVESDSALTIKDKNNNNYIISVNHYFSNYIIYTLNKFEN